MSLENVQNYVDTVRQVALERGEPYALEHQRTSYSYAFGFVSSNLKICLEALNLTEEQLGILETHTKWLKEWNKD